MNHYSVQKADGTWLHASAYNLEDMEKAWSDNGQGHHHAMSRKFACVVIPCDKVLAMKIARDFCENMFNIPTCTYYDGKELCLYCGDAGSGWKYLVQSVKEYCLTNRFTHTIIE